jgi:hypothetical protein
MTQKSPPSPDTIGIVELSCATSDLYHHIEVTTSGAGDEVAELTLISEVPDQPPVTFCLTRDDLEELTWMVMAATEEDEDEDEDDEEDADEDDG